MTKIELTEIINQGIRTEETAVAVYSRHLKVLIQYPAFSIDDRKKISEDLSFLIEKNREHKKKLQDVLERLQGDKANDY